MVDTPARFWNQSKASSESGTATPFVKATFPHSICGIRNSRQPGSASDPQRFAGSMALTIDGHQECILCHLEINSPDNQLTLLPGSKDTMCLPPASLQSSWIRPVDWPMEACVAVPSQ